MNERAYKVEVADFFTEPSESNFGEQKQKSRGRPSPSTDTNKLGSQSEPNDSGGSNDHELDTVA